MSLIEHNGLELETVRDVYEPAEDSLMAARVVDQYLSGATKKNLSVLDVGTGTGILGLTAATSDKVKKVLMVDLNDEAIALAKRNCERNKAKLAAQCDFVKSDLFASIGGTFDFVIMNAPYLMREPEEKQEIITKAWEGGITGIELSLKFLDQVKKHTKRGGVILLTHSSLSPVHELYEKITQQKLKILKKEVVHIFFEDITVLLLEN